MTHFPLLATVSQTQKHCEADGIKITLQQIKDIVKSGEVATARSLCGMVLISYPSLKTYLKDVEIPERYMLQETR